VGYKFSRKTAKLSKRAKVLNRSTLRLAGCNAELNGELNIQERRKNDAMKNRNRYQISKNKKAKKYRRSVRFFNFYF